MPKPVTQPILLQLGAVMNPMSIRVVSSDTADTFSVECLPQLPQQSSPFSITARGGTASDIDWEQAILHPSTYEEGLAAIQRAGELGDARAVESIIMVVVQSDPEAWFIYMDDGSHVVDAAHDAVQSIGEEALPICISILERVGEFDDNTCVEVAWHIEEFAKRDIDCRKAIPALLKWIEVTQNDGEEIADACSALHAIGSKGVKPRMIESIRRNRNRSNYYEASGRAFFHALRLWDIPDGQINDILGVRRQKSTSDLFSSPLHKAAYALIAQGRDAKRLVLENSAVLKALPDPQVWITINDPELTKEALALVIQKAGARRGKLDNTINAALGVRIKDIEEAHYTFYADEILDAVAQFAQGSKLARDAEVGNILSQIRYVDGVKLRYVRREESDTNLGSKCGDCTSRGSVYFGDSMTWFVNPAYQIIKMSKGKRFIGKIHFTLGTFGREEAIIIDALEFNPQAQEGKPYYQDGVECFTEAMTFLKELARRENRSLIALQTSNSSGALDMLGGWGEAIESAGRVGLALLIPSDEVRKLLARKGYDGEISLHYQMLGAVEVQEGGRDLTDDKLPALEHDVVNPAQIASEDVAAAMRARDFKLAARYIMESDEWNQQVKTIFGIPHDMNLSPAFLAKKLSAMYRDEAVDIDSLKKGFIVTANKFLRISTD